MIYSFYGTDTAESSRKARKLIESLRTKRPDAAYEELNASNWSKSAMEGHIKGQGLFSAKYIVHLNRVMEEESHKGDFLDLIPAMKDSENIFILLEGKLLAEEKKSVEKFSEKAVVTDTAANKKIPEFNIFALADSFGERDPMKSWAIYRKAVDHGYEAEGIIGTLFWQAKSMALAGESKSAADSGLSPFVYSKAKRHASNYSKADLSKMIRELLLLYHEGHRGNADLETATERLLLTLR